LSLVLKNCRFVVVPKSYESVEVVERAHVVIDNGRVSCVGDDCRWGHGYEVYDCSNTVVMPAFGNAHTHAAMVILRGYADDHELFDWLKKVWIAEKLLDEEIVRLGTRIACIEMVRSGIAAFQDMYYFPELVIEEALSMGMRVRTGPVAGMHRMDLEPWISIAERSDLYRPVINVHSLYALDREVLEESFHSSREFGVDVQIHLSETRREVYLVRKRFGYTPIEVLQRMGWLSEKVVAVHLNWVTSWEIEYLARSRARAVLCPFSGGKLAVGSTPPMKEMIDRGISVGLGTDGACSANKLSMLTQMRSAVIIYRTVYWDTRLRASHVLYAATIGSYRAMGFEPPTLAPGSPADIIAVSLRSPWMVPRRASRIVSELVYSAEDGDVVLTIVNGRVVWSPERSEAMLKEVEYCERAVSKYLEKIDSLRGTGEEEEFEKPPFVRKDE